MVDSTSPEAQEEYSRLQEEWARARNTYGETGGEEAFKDLMTAAWRLDVFLLQHPGKAFRVFSDEMIEGAISDEVEPLAELEELGWARFE